MQCPRCEGTGSCAECSGTGSLECPTCDGRGTRTTARGASYACKTCAGEGSVPCSPDCSSCEGSGEITEQLQKETREKYRPKFVDYSPSRAVTLPLIALNVVVFLAVQSAPDLLLSLSLTEFSLAQGRLWTLLTPAFLHQHLLHILLNMYFLSIYGPVVEGLLGKGRFLLLYLVTGVTAGAASWYGNIYLDDNVFAGIGASGPLYGLIGALLAIHLRWRMVPPDDVRRLVLWGGGFIVAGFLLRGSLLDMVDHWGHLGGLVGGFLLLYLLPRPSGR